MFIWILLVSYYFMNFNIIVLILIESIVINRTSLVVIEAVFLADVVTEKRTNEPQ